MNVYTYTTDDQNGVNTHAFANEAERDAAAIDWMKSDKGYTEDTAGMTLADVHEAYENTMAGCDDLIYWENHTLEASQTPQGSQTGRSDTETAANAKYITAARLEHGSEGRIEIDDNAKVSRGDDAGAYVQAWVWVADETEEE